MIVAETIEETRRAVRAARDQGKTIALVPTMGAMHEGHMSLVDAAKAGGGFVTVSIFVNPTQFAPTEDLASYPRTPEQDLAACRQRGVDLVFMPSVRTMYPRPPLAEVTVRKLSEVLCGRSRPGHFSGVCTVVAKLFHIVQPDKAFFGAKDFQQAAILRRMAVELDFPVEVVVCPTVREHDGLAMSSRNAYLTPAQRRQAPALYQALRIGSELIARRRPPAEDVVRAMRDHLAKAAPDGQIDYSQVVDPETLADVGTTEPPVLLALAVRLGRTRLIDNVLVDAPEGAG